MKRIATVTSVVVALAAIGLVGSASASASEGEVLCSAYVEAHCPASNVAPAGSWYTLGFGPTVENSTFKLKALSVGGYSFKCTGGTFGVQTSQERSLSGGLPGTAAGSLANCSLVNEAGSGFSCSGSVANNVRARIYGNGFGWATMGTAQYPFTLTFTCGSGGSESVTCTYHSSQIKMYSLVEGTEKPRMGFFEEEKEKFTRVEGSFPCPAEAAPEVRGVDVSELVPAVG